MSTSPSRKNKIKIFIGCLLVATFFWLMTALNKDGYSMRLDYPIEFVYDHTRYTPVHPLPNAIAVNVSGNGWNLLRKSWLTFADQPIEYRVSNPLQANLMNSASLTDQISERFPSVRINYVVADTFELDFERKATRIIPVRVDSAGIDMRPGFVISSLINLTPSLISVEGPASLLEEYPDTIRLQIPMRKIQTNFDEMLPLPVQFNPSVEISHSSVLVSFEVARLLKPLPAVQ